VRILYLIRDPYPTTRPDILTLFGQRLVAKGITSDIVAMVRPDVIQELTPWPGGQAFLVFGARNLLIRSIQIFLHDLRLLIRANSYEAVVVRDRPFAAVLAMLLVRRVPVFYWMGYPIPEEDRLRAKMPDRGRLYRLALRLRGAVTGWLLYHFVVPYVPHLFVQSDRMAMVVKQKSRRQRNITVVPMGVDERQFDNIPAPKYLSVLEGRFVLVYLGLLDRIRRIDFMLDVVTWLKPRFPNIALLLVGKASTSNEKAGLQKDIVSRGLTGDVVMTGQLPVNEAWSYVRSAQIGLSAIPRGEVYDVSSPTKLVEYLALGIPVVVNDIPDQRVLVEATGAGICVEMDVEKFGQAVLDMAMDLSSFKQKADLCFDYLLKIRGYDHLSETVAEVIRHAIEDK
jgi:glycosyltransferase involved in cell wall biosynthesis